MSSEQVALAVDEAASASQCPSSLESFRRFTSIAAKSASKPTRQSAYRFMHWNPWYLANYVDHALATESPWKDSAAVQSHAAKVRDVIAKHNPDVVSMVEVQGCSVLASIADTIPAANYLPFSMKSGSSVSRNLGMLTRLLPTSGKLEPVPLQLAGVAWRKIYWTTFSIPQLDFPLLFISLHLPNDPTSPQKASQRNAITAAISKAVGTKIEEANGNLHVMISGDMNDWDDQVLDGKNNKPISHALDNLKHPRNAQGDVIDGADLVNVASALSKEERITFMYPSTYPQSLLDHWLVDKVLFRKMKVSIPHDWTPDQSENGFYSDHYPIIVDLKF